MDAREKFFFFFSQLRCYHKLRHDDQLPPLEKPFEKFNLHTSNKFRLKVVRLQSNRQAIGKFISKIFFCAIKAPNLFIFVSEMNC